MNFKTTLLATAATAALLAAVPAQAIDYTGNTTGAPLWNRPLAGTPPPALSGLANATPFSAQAFTVDADGSYSFVSSTDGFDNFTFLYAGGFDAGTPLANVVTGNDDLGNVTTSGFSQALSTGVAYYFVTTGFSNTDFGAFGNRITGPGNVTLVPEPASALLAALGLAAVGWRVRRRLIA